MSWPPPLALALSLASLVLAVATLLIRSLWPGGRLKENLIAVALSGIVVIALATLYGLHVESTHLREAQRLVLEDLGREAKTLDELRDSLKALSAGRIAEALDRLEQTEKVGVQTPVVTVPSSGTSHRIRVYVPLR